ncbi:AMP-binding protein [Catenovulum agarivorans]|uniref:AMP-binding protein n=1 Tax=Catenovulum agarivorans TaxID=1172192 RepID=UPI000318B6AC|nr:AMP-binding protein [Catenovulum agarivorans]
MHFYSSQYIQQIAQNTTSHIIDGKTGVQLNYAEFDKTVSQVETVFQLLFEQQGKCLVAIESDNSLNCLVVYFALLRSQHCLLLLESGQDKLKQQQIIQNYQINLLLDKSLINSLLAASAEAHSTKQSLIQQLPLKFLPTQTIHPDIKLLLTTSGSTGSCKYVKLTADNLQANCQSICQYLQLTANDSVVTTLPMFYSFGLSVIHTHIASGSQLVLSNSTPMDKNLWALLKQYQPTCLYGVPFFYQMLLRLGLKRLPLQSLRLFAQAGGRLDNSLILQLHEYIQQQNDGSCHKQLFIMYGQTEATARMAYLQPDKLPEKVGYIGQAIPGGEFKLVNDLADHADNQGSSIQSTQAGELYYRGGNVSLGLAQNRQMLEQVEKTEWLATGDLAELDAEGDYKIIGRLKRFIKIVGKRINLDEVEAWLSQSNLARNLTEQAQILASGEDDKLVLVMAGKLAANHLEQIQHPLIQYATELLSVHASYLRVVHIEQLPLTANHKVDYNKLKQQVLYAN